MMRAHLAVLEGLLHAFQQPDMARLLRIKIEAEALVLAEPPKPKHGNDENDFKTQVVEGVLQSSPAPTSALLIFTLDDGTRVLVKYLALSCPVREKILYSSAVVDLKRGLGSNLSLFEAHDRDDVTFESMLGALGKKRDARGATTASSPQREQPAPLPLTRLEELSLTERGMERDTGVRLHGMSRMTFEVQPDVTAALVKVLAAGEPENWLALKLAKETVVVSELLTVSFDGNPDGGLASLLPTDEPRFVVVAKGAEHLFLYSCPQAAPIKQKFAYSTAKQMVVEALGAAKAFDRVLEVGDADDLAQALALSSSSGTTQGEAARTTRATRPSSSTTPCLRVPDQEVLESSSPEWWRRQQRRDEKACSDSV